MKKLILAAALAAAVASPVLADDDHTAKHGGAFVAGREADYELVARPDVVQLFVYDHGKPMDVAKASAKLTLLSGAEKQEVDLKPAAGKLEATGTFKVGPGTKAVAVVTNVGKTVGTARFTLK
jgi:hypothetical protein